MKPDRRGSLRGGEGAGPDPTGPARATRGAAVGAARRMRRRSACAVASRGGGGGRACGEERRRARVLPLPPLPHLRGRRRRRLGEEGAWVGGKGDTHTHAHRAVMSVGGSERNEEFLQQLRLQELYAEKQRRGGQRRRRREEEEDDEDEDDEDEEDEGPQDPFTYTDPADGTEYEWDRDKRAWFPKVTEDFLATYHANYGFPTEGSEDSSTSVPKAGSKPPADAKARGPQKPSELRTSQPADGKQKGEKRKPDAGWFHVEDQRNTNVYVTGLPPDITKDEFVQVMSKCGIVMRDPQTEEPKIKLYKDREGNLKGDGLCCYLKRESVDLALKLLDENEIRGYKMHVEVAQFQLKGEYDASKKKKKCKDYKKKLSQQQKLLDWRPERKEGAARLRNERVIIIRNMFHPKDFEEDPLVLNEIREDLRLECEKFGEVKKVLIFDRHPDGVASVAFKEAEEGDLCKQALNGRWFGGRQLSVETWDGVTDYQVEETAREREERLKGWESFIGDPAAAGTPKVAAEADAPESGTPAAEGPRPPKDNGASAGDPPGGPPEKADTAEGPPEDGTASTDSSVDGSDEEAET